MPACGNINANSTGSPPRAEETPVCHSVGTVADGSLMMSVAIETLSTPLPIPAHFAQAEQSFSLKKRRLPFSSPSPHSSPLRQSCCRPLRPSTKVRGSVSRVFTPRASPWSPLSRSLSEARLPMSLYDPGKPQSFLSQCFSHLGLLGCGSFGEVYKVLSHLDGRQYAVKRSVHRFRGSRERTWSVREARNHERLGPHPHILDFVAAWEEGDRLQIQTELCCTNLLLHAENQLGAIDEATAWAYLCDLLLALQHVHSQGFVHLDVKPANVFLTQSGRLKLGDFGLLMELRPEEAGMAGGQGAREDLQEGDPRYMALELLRGEYGPAADVFSLGVSILELVCNIEVPKGGEGWQQLRQGHLPTEFTRGLSSELQTVLKMMLSSEPSERASVTDLLSLPSIRRHLWRRRLSLLLQELMLVVMSLCQSTVWFGWRLLSYLKLPWLSVWKHSPAPCTPPREDSWEKNCSLPPFISTVHGHPGDPEDDTVFLLETQDLAQDLSPSLADRVRSRRSMGSTSTPLPDSTAHTPTHIPSSTRSTGSMHSRSGAPRGLGNPAHSRHSLCSDSSQCQGFHGDEVAGNLSWNLSIEPKNLLSLFEETEHEDLL